MNAYFWLSGKEGKLQILRCDSCGYWIHPYAGRCPKCGSASLAPQPVSGRGKVVGFSINHQPWYPGVQVPYTLALVSLDEQDNVRLMTNMPRTPIDKVRIGLPVEVHFEPLGDLYLPQFDAIEGEDMT